MRIPKRYGDVLTSACPFCGEPSTTKNFQQVPTCIHHKDMELSDLKCVCGEALDLACGKYGSYFRCMKCGNVNFKRALEMNGYPLKHIEDL